MGRLKEIYHIKPIYKSFIWGSDKLKNFFELQTTQKKIGTIYHVIAIPNHLDNIVVETGEHLSQFYKSNSELFKTRKKYFPVRMTTTANNNFQSYQLHPNDTYAFEHENQPGKVSGAVSLHESDEIKEILFGNKAKSRDEFKQLVLAKNWKKLFNKIKVKEGDFLHTPSGVIHGGYGDGKVSATFGTDGDITYRFFDLGRNDPKRPLNLKAVFACANIPEISGLHATHPQIDQYKSMEIYNYHDMPGEYTAKRFKIYGKNKYEYPSFMFFSCVGGSGTIGGNKIRLGETLFIPANYGEFTLSGHLDLICVSYRD